MSCHSTSHCDESPPGSIRILLGETASRALLEAGEAFLIVGKTSMPDAPGRMAIYCQPVPMELACQACEVAMGARKPGKRITPPSATA